MSGGELFTGLVILVFFVGAVLMGVSRPWDATDAEHHPDLLDPDGPIPPSEESGI